MPHRALRFQIARENIALSTLDEKFSQTIRTHTHTHILINWVNLNLSREIGESSVWRGKREQAYLFGTKSKTFA